MPLEFISPNAIVDFYSLKKKNVSSGNIVHFSHIRKLNGKTSQLEEDFMFKF